MLELSRGQILAFRRRVGALDERLSPGPASLRRAAWAGLQDSAPRSALLSIHARVERTEPDTGEDPSLVQVWGPRFSAYVIAARDLAVFTLGRLPEGGAMRRRGEDLSVRLRALLGNGRMTYARAGRELGVSPNQLRYAAPTGTVLMRWDGAHQPVIWSVAPPDTDPAQARLELARRYLHVFGPATAAGYATWAGISPRVASETFDDLGRALLHVRTPIGEAWILKRDEEGMRTISRQVAPARLLPSGDAYFLLKGAERAMLVEEAADRARLWTPRVWPGAVLVEGEIVGTWRRAQHEVVIRPWRRLSATARDAVEAEAVSLPLPGLTREMVVEWER